MGLFRKSQVYLANLCGESLGFFWQITDLFGESRVYLTNHGFIWQITDLFDESRVYYLVNHGFI